MFVFSCFLFFHYSYLLFYQHNVDTVDGEDDVQGKPLNITHMWETLGSQDRNVYSSMASLNMTAESKHLSDDLVGIDLNPFQKQESSTIGFVLYR